jgi:hypothetical protein
MMSDSDSDRSRTLIPMQGGQVKAFLLFRSPSSRMAAGT